MAELSAEQIAQRAYELNLLSDWQLQEVWGVLGSRSVPAEDFKQVLLRREILTSYQLTRLVNGERSGYFYGDYRVLYYSGSGTFARVYRAAHKETNEIVALKVLRQRHRNDQGITEQFAEEGRVGMTLRHPNIVPIHEVVSRKSLHFLVMEFVEGRNLREFVRIRKRCEPTEAVRLMADVARALDYAFGRGICHRDIKMSNVLVSSHGEAKLVDFGLAAPGKETSDDAREASANPRTIDYAGLERTTGVRRDDKRSDIYFVGSMLYHMLTGTPPLPETKDRMKRLSKTRFQEMVPIHRVDPSLPRIVTKVVNKAMQLDPNARHQSPADLLAGLETTFHRLSEAAQPHSIEDEPEEETLVEEDAVIDLSASPQRSVMFVEANPKMQDLFRRRFKQSGFRVLVTSDPGRALARFEEFEPPAQCIVFCSDEIGESAIDAFRQFAEGERTKAIPAVLMLGEEQREWAGRPDVAGNVNGAEHRLVVQMPITLGRFRAMLESLIPDDGSEILGK